MLFSPIVETVITCYLFIKGCLYEYLLFQLILRTVTAPSLPERSPDRFDYSGRRQRPTLHHTKSIRVISAQQRWRISLAVVVVIIILDIGRRRTGTAASPADYAEVDALAGVDSVGDDV